MVKKDKIIWEKSKTKDYISKATTVLKEKNSCEEIESLTEELKKSNETLKILKLEQQQCEKKISHFIDEKNELLDKIHQYELMKLDLKLKKYTDMEEKLQKGEHRISISKKLLDESRDEIKLLKNIINDYENIKFLDFIRNKKPDSVGVYKDKFGD
ncbi:MAG: hypothetical protein FWH54_03810 [Methanobrevibacter sp.]|nr:hypothetical protein [Methanobrevibacter sp.]